jgi:MFS family permease
MVTSDRMKWFALALLCAVQFMVVLDIAIVNVALPSIQTDLGFSQENLQWVISAYALVFGGFLLLGGTCPSVSSDSPSRGRCSPRAATRTVRATTSQEPCWSPQGSIFRLQTLTAANVAGMIMGTAMFSRLARGVAEPAALTEGVVNAFWAGAAIAFAGVLVSIFLVRGRDLRLPEPEVS